MKRWIKICLLLALIFALCIGANDGVTNRNKLLLVSIDCFMPAHFELIKDMPGFRYLTENGVRAEFMTPVFPTWTSPNHASIATGLYAESHGVLHNFYYDRRSGVINDSFYGSLAVNEWWDNGQEPIWITASNQGLKSGGYLFPGSNATIKGRAATRSILETQHTIVSESEWKRRIDETLSWFTEEDFDFIALYFEQPDSDGHDFGPHSKQVHKITLPMVDRTVHYLLDKVEKSSIKDELDVIILSDHGMLTLDTSVDAIYILESIDSGWVSFELCFGPIGLVDPLPEKRSIVYEALKAVSQHMDVYYKEDLPERLHFKNSNRITSIVVIAHPGYSIFNRYPRTRTVIGDHGYDNELANMKASYFSIGPSFKKGFSIDGFDMVNIYPLMCHLLGLDPAPNNGSLDVLSHTLKETWKDMSVDSTTSLRLKDEVCVKSCQP